MYPDSELQVGQFVVDRPQPHVATGLGLETINDVGAAPFAEAVGNDLL